MTPAIKYRQLNLIAILVRHAVGDTYESEHMLDYLDDALNDHWNTLTEAEIEEERKFGAQIAKLLIACGSANILHDMTTFAEMIKLFGLVETVEPTSAT